VVDLYAISALHGAARLSGGCSYDVSIGPGMARIIYALHSEFHNRPGGGLPAGRPHRDGRKLPCGGRGVAAQVACGDGRERRGIPQRILDAVRLSGWTQQRFPDVMEMV